MEPLTHQEESVMLHIWKLKDCQIKDILAAMKEELPYTTLASIVKNLEKKKYVQSKKNGLAYNYSPKIKEEQYKERFMKSVVNSYFNNSYKDLVSFFVEKEKIDVAELEEILSLIKKGKK